MCPSYLICLKSSSYLFLECHVVCQNLGKWIQLRVHPTNESPFNMSHQEFLPILFLRTKPSSFPDSVSRNVCGVNGV